MKVQGKTWVVTGGGSGIGRELVLLLLRKGARVAAVDVRADNLEQMADLAGAPDRLSLHELDITDRAATQALVADVVAAHGAVDGLINNAGIIQPFVSVNDLDYDVIDRVLDVNLMGTLYMVKSFLPTLLDRPQAHIANVSSMGGFFPFPGQTIYGASKAAVKLLTEGLYAELLDTKVHVSVIMPGAVATGITENSGVTMTTDPASSRIPQTAPDKAARIIIDGIEANRLHIFVGKDARIMDVAIKLAPKQATKLVQRQMKGLLAQPGLDSPA
ncbi:MAG: hypothetical protein QG597_1100 [Actinomycetota bacterium]|nr:hypothetical protein [Actinomycetota bacterium]